MAWTSPSSYLIESSQIQWLELTVNVIGDAADQNVTLFGFDKGNLTGLVLPVKNGDTLRLASELFPSITTFIGNKLDGSKAYIVLNIDLNTAVAFNVVAVDESGAASGGNGSAHIAGTVAVDGVPAARDIVIISDDPTGRKVVGEGSSATDGSFDISYTDWDGAVIALAMDQYGSAFVPSAPINLAAVIHPTVPNGYVYEVTGAGTTGATEPVWSTTGTVESGSVTFNPRPYYRPVASGPLQGEIITPP